MPIAKQYRRQERDASGTVSIDAQPTRGSVRVIRRFAGKLAAAIVPAGPSCVVGDRLGEYATCVIENWSEVDEHQETGADNDTPSRSNREKMREPCVRIAAFQLSPSFSPPLHARSGIL